MKIIKNASIKVKILSTVLSITIILSAIIYSLIYFFSGRISNDISEEVKMDSRISLESLSRSIYNSCESTDQILSKYLQNKLDQYKKLIKDNGSINFSKETIEWNATNQFTGQSQTVSIPKVNIGNSWIGKVQTFETKQNIVDDLNEENFTFTIFQKMNDQGDMLRVATNVKSSKGIRAIGTFIPAYNQNDEKNVVETVLRGLPYTGNAFVVNDYYQTIYEPIKDNNGSIIGMIYVGVSLKAADKLQKMISSIKVGKSGYAYVLAGSGDRKGHYIFSKNGERDGENVWDTKDSDGKLIIQEIIEKATKLNDGSLDYIEYNWLNSGDDKPKNKVVALMYYKPFDWVIGVGVNQEDLDKTALNVGNSFDELYIYLAISVVLLLVIIYFITVSISNIISKPIVASTNIMGMIAKGQINAAIQTLEAGANA